MSEKDAVASSNKSWFHQPAGSFPWVRDVFSLDTRSLALARIGLGCMLIRWYLVAMMNVELFWTDEGVLPRELAENLLFSGQWSFHLLSGEPAFQWMLIALGMAAALAFTVGYHTRLACALSVLLLLSAQIRNPWIVNGGDIILRSMLFWMIWLPMGARFSMDARRQQEKSASPRTTSLACIALMTQMIVIYFFNGMHKSDPVWHTHGTAVELSLQHYGTHLGLWLADFPSLTNLLTHSVLWMELALPWFLFFPWKTNAIRTLVVGVFVSFHLGLFFTMELGIFPWIAVVAWFAFLPGSIWNLFSFTREEDIPVQATPSTPIWKKGVLIGFLVLMLAWNLGTLVRSRDHIPLPAQQLTRAIGLDQNWKMFAPAPAPLDAWFLLEGKTENGKSVDAYTPEKAFTWDPPERISVHYHDLQWRKYFEHLSRQKKKDYGHALATYLCQQWNENQFQGETLQSVAVHFRRLNENNSPEPLLMENCQQR